MCHAHPDMFHAASSRARESGRGHRRLRKMIARPLLRKTCFHLIAVPVGLVFAVLGDAAHASDRTVILNYICTTYESARQVALERTWERPESLPGDCHTLFQRPFEMRVAEIHQVVEVVPIGHGRWIKIGRVRRSSIESGYSAGMAEQLFLF